MLNEYSHLRYVGVRHPRELFRDKDYVARHWGAHEFGQEPDFSRSIAQYETFLEHLTDAGARLETVPAHPEHSMAALYARDSSLLAPGGVVPARMFRDYRAPEPVVDATFYRERGYTVLDGIAAPGKIEGGDMVWFDATRCAVGRGYRTNAAGIQQFQQRVGRDVHIEVAEMPYYRGPGYCLHLMSVLSPVDTDLAVVYSPPMPVVFRNWLQETMGLDLVEVPDDEFDKQGANVLAVAPRKVLIADAATTTIKRLEAKGCEVIPFPADDLCIKGVGGPTCLTRPLVRG